eukprot:5780700-Pleurochrysis_carterae.AAC.6
MTWICDCGCKAGIRKIAFDRWKARLQTPADLLQGRLWNKRTCIRYLLQMLDSERLLKDDKWVACEVKEVMMHWHANGESRRMVQEMLVPAGPEPEPVNRWPCEQLRHFRVALPSAMSLAARKAFISGVPTSDARSDFGLHVEG